MPIDTDAVAAKYRARMIDPGARRLLLSRLAGSDQEADLTIPPNCEGLGRVRHFRREAPAGWVSNPLPIDPALRALGLPSESMVRAQVFQNAACNWRCWYCFVPFNLLAAQESRSRWVSAEELVGLYLAEPEDARPRMLDLTGGQPDLTPEWVPWMMDALEARGLHASTYLWSDDNLSTDYFWRYLSEKDIARIEAYPRYGRVGCFKGFDAESFAFNTEAPPEHFDRQFDLFSRFSRLGIDLYAYATFTSPPRADVAGRMKSFVDRLQAIHEFLPLRTIPLRVAPFSPVQPRLDAERLESMKAQHQAIDAWTSEIEERFGSEMRSRSICDVPRPRAA